MPTWDEVSAQCAALPETELGLRWRTPTWRVGGRAFAWLRPLRARDLEELGAAAASGEIVALATGDVDEAVALAQEGGGFFRIRHFDDFAAVLVALERIDPTRLAQAVEEAWLAVAPDALAREFLGSRG